MSPISFQGRQMSAVQTAPNGVINEQTTFSFMQLDKRVFASYAGGKVKRGMLVGKVYKVRFSFSYAQENTEGMMQGGLSECQISLLPDGRIRLSEHFDWPGGKGLNIIEECC